MAGPSRFQLETERLTLVPLAHPDGDALHRLLTHPDVRRFLLDDVVVSREWTDEHIRRSTELFEAEGYGLWALREKDAATLRGFAGYAHFFEPPRLQLLYAVDPARWGRGLASEAARAVVRHGFERLGFAEVRASTDSPNVRSIRVLERLGMRFERATVEDGRETIHYVLERDGFEREGMGS